MHRCYACSYRRNSAADIRIGDCMTAKYHNLGYSPSVVIVNTNKGSDFFDFCKDNIEFIKESYDEVDSIQESKNMDIPSNYDQNLNRLKKGEYPENLIKSVMIFGRVKAFIKKTLELLQKKEEKESLADIGRKEG